MPNPWLHRYAVLLSLCTLTLLVIGGLVSSKEAGLSIPDWPLSYGRLIPPMTDQVSLAFSHRVVAALVGLLTLGLAIWLSAAEKRAWLRWLGWISVVTVFLQAGLGGMAVVTLLPPPVSVIHGSLAQLFFSATVAIALCTSPGWEPSLHPVEDHGWPSLRSLALVTPAITFAQVALGAAFRHRAMGVLSHIVGAMVAALVILMVGIFVTQQFPEHKALRPAAVSLMVITAIQVFLGIGAFTMRMVHSGNDASVVSAGVAHGVSGALTLAASVVLAIQIRRNVYPAPEEE